MAYPSGGGAGGGSFDVIVIGAGVEGSSTAYTLAKEGRRVLLLDQFPVGHSRGSSGGYSRITRFTYSHDFYIRMMKEVFPMWADIERQVGETLYTPTGGLWLFPASSGGVEENAGRLRQEGIPLEVLQEDQLKERFPQLRLQPGVRGLLEPSCGALRADRCLAALQTLFKRHGGMVHDMEKVTSVLPRNEVTVTTSKCVYTSSKVVLATGPWTKQFAPQLGLDLKLRVYRGTVMYWQVRPEAADQYEVGKLPIVVDKTAESHFVYALPVLEFPGQVKVALHGGPDISPDLRDRPDSRALEGVVADRVARMLPGLEPTPALKEFCIYSTTPDSHPYIGTHPQHSNIVVLAGFSGHGFKLAPMVGRLTSQLLYNQPTAYDTSVFRLDRFTTRAAL